MHNHPDSHLLDEWYLYGPKNPNIFRLVSQLAHSKGMRVNEIEDVIEQALRKKWEEVPVKNI